MAARLIIARSTTVAIRYCAVRRQFKQKGQTGPDESAVLDYPTVQIRLFPLLAAAFALHYSGQRMGEIYDRTRSDIENRGDLSALADLHSLSSGLKSLSTELASGSIEICRRAMGGHGYHGGSGLIGLNADYLSKPTVEGDNWMITQQMARYLIKKAKLVASTPGFKPGNHTEETLSRFRQRRIAQDATKWDVLNNDAGIVEAFEHRAAFLVRSQQSFALCLFVGIMLTYLQTFKSYEALEVQRVPWNKLLIQLHDLSNGETSTSPLWLQFRQLNTWIIFAYFNFSIFGGRSGAQFLRGSCLRHHPPSSHERRRVAAVPSLWSLHNE